MNIKQIKTLGQVEGFLISVGSAELPPASKDEAYRLHFVPYINYHRRCFFPIIAIRDKGKARKNTFMKHDDTL